jgi:hypothetical protein
MGRPPKKSNPRSESADIFARAMLRLMEREWPAPEYPTVTHRLERLWLRSRVPQETLRKLSKGEGNPDFESLHKVAVALKSDLSAMFAEDVARRATERHDAADGDTADELQRRRR